jgi:hypothetical protein
MIRHNSFKESWMTSKHIDFFSFEGTCTPTSTNLGVAYHWIWTELCSSLYYCLIKHCLKHCVCFYAIPLEILKIVCLYQVHVLSLFRSDELSPFFIFSGWLCFIVSPFFGRFASEEIIYKSLYFACFTQWLLST